jgi:succinate dehydrogenase/fumarate reductase flavoprotein subunit
MTRAVGILRTGPTLEAAEAAMLDAVGQAGVSGRAAVGPWGGSDLDLDLIDDATLVALLVTHCARQRRESRGGHTRLDHPTTAEVTSHTTVTLHDVLDGARDSWDGALTRLEQAARRVEDSSHPAPAPADLEPTDLVHSGGSR